MYLSIDLCILWVDIPTSYSNPSEFPQAINFSLSIYLIIFLHQWVTWFSLSTINLVQLYYTQSIFRTDNPYLCKENVNTVLKWFIMCLLCLIDSKHSFSSFSRLVYLFPTVFGVVVCGRWPKINDPVLCTALTSGKVRVV